MATKCFDEASEQKFADVSDVPEYMVRDSASWSDAQETMLFARMLETIKARVYETKYPELKGRRFVPEGNEAGPATQHLTYRVWNDYVMAKVVGNGSTDIPLVASSAAEVSVKPFVVADGYQFTVDDLRAAQAAGVPMEARYARAVRMGIELLREEHTAFGIPEGNVYGLLNHPNIATVTLPNGAWNNIATTGEQILADLNFVVTSMLVSTNEIFAGDTLLLTVEAFRLISTKLLNSANGSNISVLQAFQAQNPGITVDTWSKLRTAGPNGAPRALFYKRDSEVLEFEVAIPFEQMPVEVRALTYTTVCRARWFGVQIQYPAALSYFGPGL